MPVKPLAVAVQTVSDWEVPEFVWVDCSEGLPVAEESAFLGLAWHSPKEISNSFMGQCIPRAEATALTLHHQPHLQMTIPPGNLNVQVASTFGKDSPPFGGRLGRGEPFLHRIGALDVENEECRQRQEHDEDGEVTTFVAGEFHKASLASATTGCNGNEGIPVLLPTNKLESRPLHFFGVPLISLKLFDIRASQNAIR